MGPPPPLCSLAPWAGLWVVFLTRVISGKPLPNAPVLVKGNYISVIPPPTSTLPEESRDLQSGPGGQSASVGASEADPGAGGGDVEEAGECEAGRGHVSQPGLEGGLVWSSSLGIPEDSPTAQAGKLGTGTQRHE